MLRWELHLRKASMYINGGHQDEEFMLSNLTTAVKGILPKMSKRATGKKYIYWEKGSINTRTQKWALQDYFFKRGVQTGISK